MVDVARASDPPLGYLLYRVRTALRPEVSAVLGPLGLTLAEFVCMRVLSMHPGISSAQLSRHTNVTPQAMNTVLHRLQNRGTVTRPASAPAGRALPATLTGDGQKLLRRAESAVRVADERVLARLSSEEQAEFKRMLRLLGADQ